MYKRQTLLIAKTLNIPVPNYFVGYQLRLYFLVAVVTAVAHFLWQRYRDRLDGPMDVGDCESCLLYTSQLLR